MNEVSELNSNGGIEFNLITGDIKLEVPGNYVLATGCGSGKTSAMIDLILKKKSSGVLYSAKTIEECENMYAYLCDHGLKDEIILLHSSSEDNQIYINTPEYIRNYNIVICTHYKLMNTPSELLLTLTTTEDSVPPHMRYWNSPVVVNMRKYILIDEMIEKPGFTTLVPKSLIASILMAVNTGVISKSKYGYDYQDMLKWYHEYSNVLKSDPLRSIDQYKAEYTLSLISEHLDKYKSKLDDDSEYIEVSYTLLDLLPGRKSEDFNYNFPFFMILDGTGDIYYKNSEELTILTTKERYKSKIKINQKIPFSINRYQKNDYNQITKEVEVLSDTLSEIIKSHKKTLIITWMNIKNDVVLNSRGREFLTLDYDYITELISNLEVYDLDPESYSIIHYQSGNDRATNEFIDCDAVCFIGVHKVHSLALMKANKYNRTHMTQLDYQAQMIVQAICRTQIRLHNPKVVTDVYFSEDWSDSLIDYVDRYINKNESVKEITRSMNSDSWLNDFLPRFRDRINILNSYFSGAIKDQALTRIEDRTDMELYMPKHDLVDLIPSNGSISHYDPLLIQLANHDIRLTIGVPKSKYIKVSKDGKMLPYTILQREIKEYLAKGYKIETEYLNYHV